LLLANTDLAPISREVHDRILRFLGVLGVEICMHSLYSKADQLSRLAIGAAIEVHRLKGPGLIESIYERCWMRELELRQIAAGNQRLVRIEYKGLIFDEPLRCDVLVEDCLLLELKCVQGILPIQLSRVKAYRRSRAPDSPRGQPLSRCGRA
jgi:GxxExxY protein